jgi:hypothetical protein
LFLANKFFGTSLQLQCFDLRICTSFLRALR